MVEVPYATPKILANVGPKKTEKENFIWVPKIGPNLTLVKYKNKSAEIMVKMILKNFFVFMFLNLFFFFLCCNSTASPLTTI